MAVQPSEDFEHDYNELAETAETNLDLLFYPKNIAIVGASNKGRGMMWGGNSFIEGALKQGFKGKIFPVNPKAETIMGMKVYKSVVDIPDPVDLAIFSVHHSAVLSVMSDCIKKGVKFVHLFTAGFSETGKEDLAKIERKFTAMAKQAGIRLIGPNCMGIYNPEGGLAWTDDFPASPGSAGFVSQSGQLAGHFVEAGRYSGLKYSKVVSFGNASDLQAHDFINYMASDEKTKFVGAYIEGLKDGRSFFEAAKNMTTKKPLVVWKGGMTEGGGRATQSHTAAIAGSPKIWASLCRQAGIISVDSMEELIGTITGLRSLPLPVSTRAAILGGAGGGSVTMTDAAERAGLSVPHLSDATIEALEEFVPPQGNSVKNPLDIMGSLFVRDNFIKLMELLRDDDNIDSLIFTQMIDMFYSRGGRPMLDAYIQMTLEGIKIINKPVFLVLDGSRSPFISNYRQEAIERYNVARTTVFPTFDLAAKVLSNMFTYKKYLDNHK